MMEEFFRNNKGLIKVEYSILHKGPADKRIRSVLMHAIGSCVKAKVPMNAPSYLELEKKILVIVYTYLSGHFDIPIDDTNLWEFILTTSTERFKAWKSACRKHWEEFGDEVPLEFTDRLADWTWLCNHFNDPANKALSEKMKRIRKAEKRMDHRSGKTSFSYRAEIHQKNGHVAPFVDSFDDAYGRDPVGKLLVAQMKERYEEVEARSISHPEIPPEEPFDVNVQVDIIMEITGETPGTAISGVGRCMSKPPRHRGGARQSALVTTLELKIVAQQEELVAQKEEIAAQNLRLAKLEEFFCPKQPSTDYGSSSRV